MNSINQKGKVGLPSSATGIMDQTIIEAWWILEENADTIDIWTEIKWSDGCCARATPHYDHCGAWYDWTLVKFDTANSGDVLLPAKALAFFKTTSDGEAMMLCHPVSYNCLKMQSSCLISCYHQEVFADGHPKLRAVSHSSIKECALRFQ